MGVDFIFRGISNTKELNLLELYLIKQGLWYPEYEKWVTERCISDIENGWKKVILVFYENKIIGNAIYQQHKELPRTREFKNMRIDSRFWRRDIGHFLLRQVETEEYWTFDRIILDIDARQVALKKFLEFCGYRTLYQAPLYASKNLDIVMIKELNKNKFI